MRICEMIFCQMYTNYEAYVDQICVQLAKNQSQRRMQGVSESAPIVLLEIAADPVQHESDH